MSDNISTGLRRIAEARYKDALASWPNHEQRHLQTLLGARLFDWECLRCHLEKVAASEVENGKD